MTSRFVLTLTLVVVTVRAPAQQLPPEPKTIPQRVAEEGSISIVHRTDAIAKNLEQILNGADLILVGRIVSSRTQLSADERSVVTDQVVQVEEVLYSDSPEVQPRATVVFRQLGGTLRIGSSEVKESDDNLPILSGPSPHLLLARKDGDSYWILSPAVIAFVDGYSRCVSSYPDGFGAICGKSSSYVISQLKEHIRLRALGIH